MSVSITFNWSIKYLEAAICSEVVHNNESLAGSETAEATASTKAEVLLLLVVAA